MPCRRLMILCLLAGFAVSAASADEIGRPDPRQDPSEDGTPVLAMVGGGLLGAGLGAGVGVLIGAIIADDGHDDFLDFDTLAGALVGAAALEPFGLATGVHLAGGRDDTYGRTLLTTLGASALVVGVAAAADEGTVMAALVPVQLIAAIWSERRAGSQTAEPTAALQLSPWVDEERRGFLLAGRF